MLEPLLIRADAGERIGAGHLMRCLALAQAWLDTGGRAEFLSASMPPLLEARLVSEQISLTLLSANAGSDCDAQATVARARQIGARWIVVDGYQFGAKYQQRLKEADCRLLFIDDYGHCDYYCADLILNQNFYAHEDLYARRENYTRLLLGTRHALLRREFWSWKDFRRKIPRVARKLLVTLGGADPCNVAAKVLHALRDLP